MSMIAQALHIALQKKIGQLYENLFAALAIAGNNSDDVAEAEQAFQRGIRLAKNSYHTALQLSGEGGSFE